MTASLFSGASTTSGSLRMPHCSCFDQTNPVFECALVGKAIYEGFLGAAEFAERTKSNAFDLLHGIGRVRDSPAPAFQELVLLPWLWPCILQVSCRLGGPQL